MHGRTGSSRSRITSTPESELSSSSVSGGASKATGIPVDMRFAQVWTYRDGQAMRMQMYANPDEAIEAAGLSE